MFHIYLNFTSFIKNDNVIGRTDKHLIKINSENIRIQILKISNCLDENDYNTEITNLMNIIKGCFTVGFSEELINQRIEKCKEYITTTDVHKWVFFKIDYNKRCRYNRRCTSPVESFHNKINGIRHMFLSKMIYELFKLEEQTISKNLNFLYKIQHSVMDINKFMIIT